MRITLLLAAITVTVQSNDNWKVLHPCFERYGNHRLVNLKPFHSEYRMPTEDHCLRFCAETSSRCRSIVYETGTHICHFFMEEGAEMAIISPKMTYFKVTSKDCLENVVRLVERMEMEGPPVEYSPIEETTIRPPIVDTTTLRTTTEGPTTTTESPTTTTATRTRKYSKLHKQKKTTVRVPVPTEPKMDEMSTEIAQMVEMMDVVTSQPVTRRRKPQIGGEAVVDPKTDVERKLREKMRELRALYPEKFRELLASEETEERQESRDDERTETLWPVSSNVPKQVAASSHGETVDGDAEKLEEPEESVREMETPQETETYRGQWDEEKSEKQTQGSKRSRFFGNAKRIQVNEMDMDPLARRAKKKEEEMILSQDDILTLQNINLEGVRKSPHNEEQNEMESPDSSRKADFSRKAKSFLDTLKKPDETPFDVPLTHPSSAFDSMLDSKPLVSGADKMLRKKTKACSNGDTPIWIVWENSEADTGMGADSNWVEKERDCEDMCNVMDGCRGYTFYDKQSQCQTTSDFDGVSLKSSPKKDYSVATHTKFCFSDSISLFKQCSVFQGFRDFALEMIPREQFDGLPNGYEGLQLCMELCVLSTDFTCKSASFISSEGRCLLNDQDSLTKSSEFRESLAEDHLYFENGCSRASSLTEEEREATNARRIQKSSPNWLSESAKLFGGDKKKAVPSAKRMKTRKAKVSREDKSENRQKPLRAVRIRPDWKGFGSVNSLKESENVDGVEYTGEFRRLL